MQLTRFDRWLRERFVYETHVYTLRPPSPVPRGVKKRSCPKSRGSRYQHLYVPKNEVAEKNLIHTLQKENQIFTTKIVERNSWYRPLIAPESKSVTWWLISAIMLTTTFCATALYLYRLWQNPLVQQRVMEAIEILKG